MYRRALYRGILRFRINPVIRVLILSDVIVWTADGLLAPIFAIFVADVIAGGTIQAMGIAMGIFLIAKSLSEIFVGWAIDKHPGERDDLYTAFWGTMGIAAVMFLYTGASDLWHVYVLQALFGIADAFAYPGWNAIFTRHIDRKREGFEWSLYDVSIGIAMAIAAFLGAFVVERFGFDVLFVATGVLTLAGGFVLLLIRNRLFPATRRK